MKKLWMMILALALALGLAGCGGKEENNAPALYAPHHVDDMVEAGAFSEELEELDGDIAFQLYRLEEYGLTREDLKECAVLRSAGATCEEGAVLVFSNSEKAETAEGALKDYIQNQIEANEDYRPSEIPKLKEALVDRRGESVLLAVADDLEAAKEAVK